MSPQLQIVVAVYFVPFLALFVAALSMELFERVAEVIRRDPPTLGDPPADASSPRDDSVK